MSPPMLGARASEGITVRPTSSGRLLRRAGIVRAPTERKARFTSSLIHRIAVSAAALALITACRADVATGPIGRPAVPGDALRLLTGGVGTPIFTAPPGENLAVGYAIGLNNAGQVTGAEFGLIQIDDTNKPYRWTPGVGAQKISVCSDTGFGTDSNDAGGVVGSTQVDAVTGMRGFVAPGNTGTRLSILPGMPVSGPSRAFAINL